MTDVVNGNNFAALFSAKEVLCRTPLVERDPVIQELLRLLAYYRGIGNVDEALQAVLAREEEMSTLVAPGIAMPHARLASVTNLAVAVATSPQGIRFREGDEGRVRLVILILTPKDQPGAYLQAVSSLTKILKDPSVVPAVVGLKTAEEVWRFFDRGGLILPDHVCAGDIMNRDVVTLQETDTLQHAIDMLVHHRMIDMAVVDKSGDLVGVVSAYELLRVCLPDYILWMEDLSPIINFEPFAEILRNEGKTWLAEIMSFDYATVAEDAPAVQVAKEITKHGARAVYVMRGEQLVGVITLQDFMNKVLRE